MKSNNQNKEFFGPITAFALIFFVSQSDTVAKASTLTTNNFLRQPNMCVSIPDDLKLCHDVGYKRMVLPNLLNHESLDEARQQAASFVPLLNRNCHNHLKEFLCSLFAPVCLPPDTAVLGPIPPCKSLCKSVERSCSPIMRRHNFDWPPMLNCSKFSDKEPCINFKSSIPEEAPVKTEETAQQSEYHFICFLLNIRKLLDCFLFICACNDVVNSKPFNFLAFAFDTGL